MEKIEKTPLLLGKEARNSAEGKLYEGELIAEPISISSWEEYRQKWSFCEAREILTVFPLHLDIELTSQCNLRCKMCWQNGLLKDEKRGLMEESIFRKIIDEGLQHGLQAIKLQSRGESTLHPKIASFVKYAKDAGVRDVQLTTNGMVFWKKQKRLEDLLASGIDKLIFSIDSEHDESALEIYGVDKAPNVREIVKTAIKLRTSLGKRLPEFRIQASFSPSQSKEDVLAELLDEFSDADEILASKIWSPDFSLESIPDLRNRFELLACPFLWTRLVVFWDGSVTLCCRDYNNAHHLGNVSLQSIQDIWLGEKMMTLRHAHLDGIRHQVPVCRNCELYICPKPAIES